MCLFHISFEHIKYIQFFFLFSIWLCFFTRTILCLYCYGSESILQHASKPIMIYNTYTHRTFDRFCLRLRSCFDCVVNTSASSHTKCVFLYIFFLSAVRLCKPHVFSLYVMLSRLRRENTWMLPKLCRRFEKENSICGTTIAFGIEWDTKCITKKVNVTWCKWWYRDI